MTEAIFSITNERSPLAGNPLQAPEYSVPLKGTNGDLIPAADPRATRALVSLMNMNAVLGGAACHFGGPSAFAELMSALHALMFETAKKRGKKWHELFHFINDAGHCENGLYALRANYGFAGLNFDDLKKFRSIESQLTGHGESHLFPEAVLMSNGPLGSAFPQSQGLAMADALSKSNRVTITAISDGACMEGEAREALAAIPGIASRGQLAPYILVLSDNNTKLSGRIDKDSFSMAPTFQSLQILGWHVISVEDGHNLQACFDALTSAMEMVLRNAKVPVVIHAKTIKGFGNKKTAESSSGGHGFPLKSTSELPDFIKEIYNGEKYPELFDHWISELKQIENTMKADSTSAAPSEKIQVGVAQAMIQCRQAQLPVVSITSDLPGSTGTAAFRKEFPQFSFDVGVAESNMISVAAGFSKCGYIPVVDTFAQFGVTKGSLPLTMASLSQSPMICIFSHTGFQDAADGASHQALSYLAMLGSIPEVDLYCLTTSEEAHALVSQAIQKFSSLRAAGKTPRTSVFFLGRENFPKTYRAGMEYKLGRAQLLFESQGQFSEWITLLPSGSMVPQAMSSIKRLEGHGIGVIVINPSIHNRPDLEVINPSLKKSQGKFITIEDHQLVGGWSQTLSAELYKQAHRAQQASLGVDGEFGQSAYLADQLYKKHNMDADAIVKKALQISAN